MNPVQGECKAVSFIADAHLGSGEDCLHRQQMLVELLASLRPQISHLYILGDLFDFWFEYRHAIPKGFLGVLRSLADLVDAGIRVVYLGGNHDFWCSTHLRNEVGVEIHSRPISVVHQGRRIFLAHGDGIGPGDVGYRMLKGLLRNPVAITLYRLIHPDVGIPLAHRISAASRRHTRERIFYLRRFSQHVVRPQFDAGHDAVIVGHVHDPIHLVDCHGRDFLIVGDWLDHFTHVRLQGGRFCLQRFRPGAPAEVIPPQAWPADLEPPAGPRP